MPASTIPNSRCDSMNRPTLFLPAILAALLSVAIPVGAQAPGYVNSSNQTGTPDYGTFMHSDIDSINLQNGGVQIRIPLLSRKGRQFDYTFGLRYDSKFW